MRFLISAILVLLTIFHVSLSAADGKKPYHVLVLHSYHQTFEWTKRVHQGITDAFTDQQQKLPIEFSVEYMDTKRIAPKLLEQDLASLYRIKYGKNAPDVIITSDDNAYQFILHNGKELFPNIPVVFCGVNNFDATLNALYPHITGVTEDFNIAGTLKSISQLQPEINYVYVVTDATPTGSINLARFRKTKAEFDTVFTFEELAERTTEELLNTLSTPKPNSAILMLSFFKDRNNVPYSTKESIRLIREVTNRPIYVCWDFYMESGVVGGKLVSGRSQGEAAAHKALSILQGIPVSQIPVMLRSPNAHIYDYLALKEQQIPLDRLPENSLILNKPISFYEQNPRLSIFVVFVIASLSTMLILLLANILRRRKTEQKLRKAEKQFRSIFENIPDAFFRTNMKGEILLVNPEGVRLLGFDTQEEATNYNILNAYYKPELRKLFLEELMQHGSVNGFEMTCQSVRGELFEVEINAHLQKDEESGAPAIIESLARDVTERKKMQEFFVQNEKMMSLGGVAAGMAHEINNPLAGILHGIQNIERRIGSDHPKNVECAQSSEIDLQNLRYYLEQRGIDRLLSGIRDSATRASGIVASMLEFSRPNEGNPEQCDVKEIVLSAIELASNDYSLAKNFDFKKIDIRIHSSSPRTSIQCFRSDLEQVLLNLLRNAAHAMASSLSYGSTPRIDIRLFSKEDATFITVADNGPGIPHKHVQHIFEPFYTTKPPDIGTGLGLSVSYFIVTQKHGGRLEIETPPAGGAKFVIQLPTTLPQ